MMKRPDKSSISLEKSQTSVTSQIKQDPKYEKNIKGTLNDNYCIYGGNEFCFIILNNFDRPTPSLPADSNV